jgi:hypothetical protein
MADAVSGERGKDRRVVMSFHAHRALLGHGHQRETEHYEQKSTIPYLRGVSHFLYSCSSDFIDVCCQFQDSAYLRPRSDAFPFCLFFPTRLRHLILV